MFGQRWGRGGAATEEGGQMTETPDTTTTETPPDETGQDPVPEGDEGNGESGGDEGTSGSEPSAD
jgi:hypothetical protein